MLVCPVGEWVLSSAPLRQEGSRTDSLRDLAVSSLAGKPDSTATLVSNGSRPQPSQTEPEPARPAPAPQHQTSQEQAGSDTEQSDLSSLLSIPTTSSGKHVNFAEVRDRQRSASQPAESVSWPPGAGVAGAAASPVSNDHSAAM